MEKVMRVLFKIKSLIFITAIFFKKEIPESLSRNSTRIQLSKNKYTNFRFIRCVV